MKDLKLGTYRVISAFGQEYRLVQTDYEVRDILSAFHLDPGGYSHLFIKDDSDGTPLEIWGCESIPWDDDDAELLYSSDHEGLKDQISYAFFAIGELAKTKRFPKTRAHFMRRILEAYERSNLPYVGTASTSSLQYCLIFAFNFGWVNAECLKFNGIDRWHLYITR
jgi:hypothetical protein